MTTTRTCNKCSETKPLTAFPNSVTGRDGRAGHCRACEVKRVAQWRKDNPDRYKQGGAARAERLRQPRAQSGTRWTQEQLDIAKDTTLTDQEVATRTERSINAVSQCRYRLRKATTKGAKVAI